MASAKGRLELQASIFMTDNPHKTQAMKHLPVYSSMKAEWQALIYRFCSRGCLGFVLGFEGDDIDETPSLVWSPRQSAVAMAEELLGVALSVVGQGMMGNAEDL